MTEQSHDVSSSMAKSNGSLTDQVLGWMHKEERDEPGRGRGVIKERQCPSSEPEVTREGRISRILGGEDGRPMILISPCIGVFLILNAKISTAVVCVSLPFSFDS